MLPLNSRPSTASEPGNQRDHEYNQEEKEQQLRDPRRGNCDTAKPEDCGNDGHNQKNQRPIKHAVPPIVSCTNLDSEYVGRVAADDPAKAVIQALGRCKVKDCAGSTELWRGLGEQAAQNAVTRPF